MENKLLPLLALKDVVLFPGMLAPIYVGRAKSVQSVIEAQTNYNNKIILTAQKKIDTEDPKESDLYQIGVLAHLSQVIKLPNGHCKILVEVEQRIKITSIIFKNNYNLAKFEIIADKEINNLDDTAHLISEVSSKFTSYVSNNKKINPEVLASITDINNPNHISNIIASHLSCGIKEKQSLLELSDAKKRIVKIIDIINDELNSLETEQLIQQRLKKQIEKTQKDYYLNEQMKAIQKELGEDDKSELADIEKKIKTLKLSKEAKEKASSELKKLKLMNPAASEAGVIRNYLDTLLNLPWGKFDKDTIDVNKAEEILNRDHFGLEKVKNRILEYIAVLQRSKKIKGPIICLMGPPGVGKTSLVKSIADATGRKYVKFALGGVRDEAEIRGHRRTYLGSMPGKIISLLKKSKTSNPVMLLDEIDKLSSDYRGDPTSALLEVLDPEQNNHFTDNYLEVEYDLSNIIFVATANSYNIPRPLLDRMEIIKVPGYIEDEKLKIAKEYLLKKILNLHNMKPSEFSITDDAILDIIRYYTKESGVRSLDRELSSIIRKCLKKILSSPEIKTIAIDSKDLEDYLGTKKYKISLAEDKDQVGVTMGMAYTEYGGELLSIESLLVPGKGEIKATGKLGDVMKESTQAAYSYFRSQAEELGINTDVLKDHDIHLHMPEGATPKDGPSAGIAVYTTICSLVTKVPVRNDIAMTGEITLRGKVLPIGGLREKLLAANRGGITTVIIPEDNIKDLKEVPQSIKDGLNILTVNNASEVLNLALREKLP